MLTIENATIGYDEQGARNAVAAIKRDVIDASIRYLNNGVVNIEQSLKDVWVGVAADQFIQNMKADANKVSEVMEMCYEAFDSCVREIIQDMSDVDVNMISDRTGSDI